MIKLKYYIRFNHLILSLLKSSSNISRIKLTVRVHVFLNVPPYLEVSSGLSYLAFIFSHFLLDDETSHSRDVSFWRKSEKQKQLSVVAIQSAADASKKGRILGMMNWHELLFFQEEKFQSPFARLSWYYGDQVICYPFYQGFNGRGRTALKLDFAIVRVILIKGDERRNVVFPIPKGPSEEENPLFIWVFGRVKGKVFVCSPEVTQHFVFGYSRTNIFGEVSAFDLILFVVPAQLLEIEIY